MPSQNEGRSDQPDPKKNNKGLLTALGAIVLVLVLTWAIATLLEIAFAKALAIVILLLFVAIVALFMVGIA